MAEKLDFLMHNLFNNYSKDFMKSLPTTIWQECDSIVDELKNDSDLCLLLKELYIENYRDYLGTVFKEFWPKFSQNAEAYTNNINSYHRCIFLAINELNSLLENWMDNHFISHLFNTMDTAEELKDEKSDFIIKLQNILYAYFIAEMPLTFSNYLLNTFIFSFKVFDHINQNKLDIKKLQEDEEEEEEHFCLDCGFNKETEEFTSKCYCVTICDKFIPFRNILSNLGIFDQLCGDIIRSVIFSSVEKHIYQLCEGHNFDISCLKLTFKWFEKTLLQWLKVVYDLENHTEDSINNSGKTNTEIGNNLSSIMFSKAAIIYIIKISSRLTSFASSNVRNFIINTYIYCRMKQLFDIIIDFPTSEPVLDDLHQCIKIDPFYRKQFIYTLRAAFESRLLHPGVSTTDIIDAYVTSIKALRLLDPQGIILQIVCDPVRNYLKTREDTVRCIITSLTSENLVDFNEASEAAAAKEGKDDDEMVLDTWRTWNPQPIGVSKLNKALINADIISMLVNIFDSKDLFVQEYQRLLAQRLLMTFEVNLEAEHRNLELLSLRFGESELHTCEVMLKDIKDSDRVNQRINSGEIENSIPTQFETNGIILSQQFWPDNLGFGQSFEDLKVLKLPDEINEAFEAYTKAFETIKANRTLNWIHQLGMVKIELELNNGKTIIDLTVRPIQAVIIFKFQIRKLWRISELAEELTLPPSIIRRNIGYWQNRGIIVEISPDTFVLDEEARTGSLHNSKESAAQEFENIDADIDEDKKYNEDDNRLQLFWNFIDNMLKNLHSLTLDRIFSMLKMFNMQSPEIESLTMHELRQFLDRKVTEGKLVYVNGLYSLKNDSMSD